MYRSLGWEMEVLKFIMNKFCSLLSKEFPVLWGRQISTEIIQKGKKGAWQVMNVEAENGSSQQKFLILNISVIVHAAFISFAKGRIKIL